MKKTVPILLAFFFLTGCAGKLQYLPIIDASLIGAKGVTQATKVFSEQKRDVVGCYVTASLIAALGSSQDVVDTWITGEGEAGNIPAVDVDVSACNALLSTPLEAVIPSQAEEQVRHITAGLTPVVFTVIQAVMGAVDVSCRDRVIAEAVLNYLRGAILPVIDELSHPDGKISIPAVAMDLKPCADEVEPKLEKAMTCPPCPVCPAVK